MKKATATCSIQFSPENSTYPDKKFPNWTNALFGSHENAWKHNKAEATLSIKPFFSRTPSNSDMKINKRGTPPPLKNDDVRGCSTTQTLSEVEEAGADAKGIPVIICEFRGILGIESAQMMLQKTQKIISNFPKQG